MPTSLTSALKDVVNEISRGNLPTADSLCRKVLLGHHNNPEAYFLLGVIACQIGNDAEGIHCIEQAIRLNPNEARYPMFFGAFYYNLGKHEECIHHLQRSLSLGNKSPECYLMLGESLREAKEIDAAEKALQQCLALQPTNVNAIIALGSVHLNRGGHTRATELFQQALELQPGCSRAMGRMGMISMEQGDTETALRRLQDAIAAAPDDPEFYKPLGRLLYEKGEIESAIDAFSTHTDLKNSLVSLARRYRTDKWGSHYYAQHYHRHFSALRKKQLNILEIGVGGYNNPMGGGASLRMWKEYFPNSRIFSLDIYDKAPIEEDRITIFRGSQDSESQLRKIAAEIGKIDIIIDDGSHINSHVIKSFETLFPLLADNGIYAVEDTQTSYWPKYGGSSTDLDAPTSMCAYFKRLTDGLNYEERLLPDYKPSYFDRHVISMHYYHNLIFVYKGENREGSNAARLNATG